MLNQKEIFMANSIRRFLTIAVAGLALTIPIRMAFAESFEQLSAEWWQSARGETTSIPYLKQ
jgi:hypothetical protein